MEENKNLQPEAISEELLEGVAGGITITKDRHDPYLCKNLIRTRSDGACDGNNFNYAKIWCDHYRRAKYGEHTGRPYWAHVCIRNGFDRYHGDENGNT
ncbi:MAG: hypothetical protein FWD38_05960 [Oscillospiraceae bacterium]|nr:hypothetical protein [Oscillospiraceae bacterium]